MCILGAGVYFMISGTAFALDVTKEKQNVPTDKITIFEQDDEKDAFTKHGFTRGDMTYLYSGNFDSSMMENISGDVKKVMRVQFPDKDCYVIAILKTQANNGKMAVNLGPIWYLEENNFMINEGDTIQVAGARARSNGRFLVLATELTKNGQTLNIRDKEGTPLWGSPKSQKGDARCMKLDFKKMDTSKH